MTDLLRACYFRVYLDMIKKGLEYSETDFLRLITLLLLLRMPFFVSYGDKERTHQVNIVVHDDIVTPPFT